MYFTPQIDWQFPSSECSLEPVHLTDRDSCIYIVGRPGMSVRKLREYMWNFAPIWGSCTIVQCHSATQRASIDPDAETTNFGYQI